MKKESENKEQAGKSQAEVRRNKINAFCKLRMAGSSDEVISFPTAELMEMIPLGSTIIELREAAKLQGYSMKVVFKKKSKINLTKTG